MFQKRIAFKQKVKTLSLTSSVVLSCFFLSACKEKTEESTPEQKASKLSLETSEQRVSYVMGYSIANQIASGGLNVDAAALMKAMDDVASGKDLAMTPEQMRSAGSIFQNLLREKKLADIRVGNIKRGEQFLQENAGRNGVTGLPSGLQYRVIETGEGNSPTLNDTVVAHYHGTLLTGTVFDSSVERGEAVEFALTDVIPGWTEVLQLMKPGDKWKVWIPPTLAYPNGTQEIPPGSVIAFEIELISIAEG